VCAASDLLIELTMHFFYAGRDTNDFSGFFLSIHGKTLLVQKIL
jgi:hypothetical protein